MEKRKLFIEYIDNIIYVLDNPTEMDVEFCLFEIERLYNELKLYVSEQNKYV
jgi:hypothetical protein